MPATLLVKENVTVSSTALSAEEIVGVIESTALEIENAVLLNPAAKDADAVVNHHQSESS